MFEKILSWHFENLEKLNSILDKVGYFIEFERSFQSQDIPHEELLIKEKYGITRGKFPLRMRDILNISMSPSMSSLSEAI
jgi:hypothetical protein